MSSKHHFKPLRKYRRPLVALGLFAIALLAIASPLNRLFDRAFLVGLLCGWGSLARLAFVALYSLLTVLGIPGTILTVAGGAVFGLGWGTVLSVVGATLGAIAAFWVARSLLRGWFEARFGEHPILERFRVAVKCHPWHCVFALRFAPIAPFNLINFLLGLTPLHWLPYAVGTFFGIVPGTLVYTWLGVSGSEALQGGDRLSFFVALGFLALLCALPALARKRSPSPSARNAANGRFTNR